WPFTRSWGFEDVEDLFSGMEDFMANRFKEISEKAPEDLVRERTLPDGGTVKEWGPFVYGYSMTLMKKGNRRYVNLVTYDQGLECEDHVLMFRKNGNH
ncbi:MAG: hypothetical protein P8Y79_15925, partial [Ignavibacteriaceae bacterium]